MQNQQVLHPAPGGEPDREAAYLEQASGRSGGVGLWGARGGPGYVRHGSTREEGTEVGGKGGTPNASHITEGLQTRRCLDLRERVSSSRRLVGDHQVAKREKGFHKAQSMSNTVPYCEITSFIFKCFL